VIQSRWGQSSNHSSRTESLGDLGFAVIECWKQLQQAIPLEKRYQSGGILGSGRNTREFRQIWTILAAEFKDRSATFADPSGANLER